jgi:hypothetical protein
MSMPQHAQGWTIDHHLIHLTFWARSVVFFLWGQPCHQGLGIEKALYLKGNIDEIKVAIYQKHKDFPLSETLTRFRHAHQQLLKVLQPLTDADLQKPYRYHSPDESDEGHGQPALDVIDGNSTYQLMSTGAGS